MGIVYLAEQETPVRRRVALKVIKPGMDSQAVLARFEAERQALALMDHPGIARMLDAGATPEGRPYFAMEHVAGIPLDSYCDRRKLDLDQRLRLFINVCQAVLHAHQKAILHRDLKPSNILVADVDGHPVPKIIDFGLAKALGQNLTDRTLFTQQGLLVGTPEYMSPEQVDPTALAVDTRTDIYSLGVILYRLVTGTLPFTMEPPREAGRLGAIRALQSLICETDAPRPSTRVTTSHEVGETVARVMGTQAATLVRRLRGDLDWITLKSLDKDRNRRYATATDLAEDIRRHLEDEPVQARPPSTIYRLRKLVRKHAGVVAALGALFVLLVAGVVTSTAFFLRSEEKRVEAEEAREDADRQKTAAILAQDQEAAQRRKAEEAEAEATRAREQEVLQRKQAEMATSEAERRRDEVLRLSDVKRLDQLQARADDLWPALPDKVPALVDWLAEARSLAANLEEHRSCLIDLERRTASGSSPETQWQHDVLEELIKGLDTFASPDPEVGRIADVERRLTFARTVREKTLGMYAVEWTEAIRSIQDPQECPAYGGLRITPQLGLLPLGRDPGSGLWEFAHLQTGEIPWRHEDGHLVIDRESGLVFVLIPGGTFLMGAQKDDPGKPGYDPRAEANEGPVHEVTLSPFFLSKFEMTQGQWERFTGENPSYYASGDLVPKPGLHPVEQVSWEGCTRITARLGLVLPTEAQWEYAARAGTTTSWWTGGERDSLIDAANLADQTARRGGATWPTIADWPDLEDGFVVHAEAGSFRANGFGLHDVHGNVWEWCRDGYGPYTDPVRPGDGERQVSSRFRVSRGGSFSLSASSARSACRSADTPVTRNDYLGLRPARVITE
jgi:formylglycine-generating enzyme required for sulfatase activity/tRNA A-37 threonylcarbamoyl transferase component Bud32